MHYWSICKEIWSGVFEAGQQANIVWSRRPPLRFYVTCPARKGGGDSGGFRQRGGWARLTPAVMRLKHRNLAQIQLVV